MSKRVISPQRMNRAPAGIAAWAARLSVAISVAAAGAADPQGTGV
ncbi:hypothetical protein [Streptomyces javensis]|nr:hypothetical protein [Streptomyces javensis]